MKQNLFRADKEKLIVAGGHCFDIFAALSQLEISTYGW